MQKNVSYESFAPHDDYDRETQDNTPFAQKVNALYHTPHGGAGSYQAHQSTHMMHQTAEGRTYVRNEMHHSHSSQVNPFINTPIGNSNAPACNSPQFTKQKNS
jgi:hypothetical protein